MRVKNILGALCISVVASLCLLSISHWTRSDFLVRFLAENLAIIQITIIAIILRPNLGQEESKRYE